LISALVALGIGPGDEVIVPSFTYVATAEAAAVLGAIPIICDVDESLTMDPNDLERRISSYTKAVIPVHMRGAPCQMDKIMEIAKGHNLFVVEDTAQACGGMYKGKRLGTWGDFGCFSFQFSKIITAVEGGMLITNSKELHERALSFHTNHGWSQFNIPDRTQLWGINFRMAELSASIGYTQLTLKLDNILKDMRRNFNDIVQRIQPTLQEHKVQIRKRNDDQGDTNICLVLLMPSYESAGQMITSLKKRGLQNAMGLYRRDEFDTHVYIHWKPLTEKRSWNSMNTPWCFSKREITYDDKLCKQSLDLLGRAVHINISPDFTEKHIEHISSSIIDSLKSLKASSA
jgi:8-amino-3,8-dideoxy-alpha-D-manno-octulosonate transaminase